MINIVKSKKIKLAMQWIIVIVILIICFKVTVFPNGRLSAQRVHEDSERSYYYGPSEIINTTDLGSSRIYLCRYKNWFSSDTVKKGIVLWYPGKEDGGTEIDYRRQITYTKSAEGDESGNRLMKIYGYVNDDEVTTICLKNKECFVTEVYELDESRLFIFCWQDSKDIDYKYLIAADKDGKVIYKDTIRAF